MYFGGSPATEEAWIGMMVDIVLVGDSLGFDGGGDGDDDDAFRGREGADIVLGTWGVVSSRLRLRFEGRYCIQRGNCLFVVRVLRGVIVVGGGRLGVGMAASTSRRQNLQRGGLVSAIPLESPVQAGGVSGAFFQCSASAFRLSYPGLQDTFHTMLMIL